jgi:glycine betaine transporter
MFDAMPMGAVMSVVATLLVVIFFVTSGDSATLVLGMMSTGGNPDPSARVKLVWGLLVAAIATSLMLAGGIKAVQTATIVFALPFTVVVVLMAVSVTRAIAHDWDEERRRERALRRRMQQLVEAPPPEAGGVEGTRQSRP